MERPAEGLPEVRSHASTQQPLRAAELAKKIENRLPEDVRVRGNKERETDLRKYRVTLLIEKRLL